MLKMALKWLLTTLYRVEVQGLENVDAAGDRVLIVANHTSFLDAILLAVFLPGKMMFAVNSFIADCCWVKPFLALVEAFPLDPTNPMATKAMIREIEKDKRCVIFPEGRITVTGSLMKVYEGPGMIADKSGAMVLPVRIDGAQYTPLSRLRGKVRLRWFPKVTLVILPPTSMDLPEELRGRARRTHAGNMLYDIMSEMMFESSNWRTTLFDSVIDAAATHGSGHVIAMDVERKPMSYRKLIASSFVLGEQFAKQTEEREYVGVLLPNMTSTLAVFFGLQTGGRIPAMLNFSAGVKSLVLACETAEIKTVISARRFVEMGKLDTAVAAMEAAGVQLVYLEDIAKNINIFARLKGLAASFVPSLVYAQLQSATMDDAAVVLFTSGSEGAPKGVVLSHKNIQANRMQLASRIDFGPTDTVFNALPVFHSFGLTGGTLLPLLAGVKVFLYPSPLHYRIVPELVYDTNATILFGTDTFLTGYARFAHPYDFYSIRYVFAGAEKLKDSTRTTWSERFGVRIFEGYGATETAPALSINTPMHYKVGTVGRLLPAVRYTLDPVPGIEDGGRLTVSGPNIMKGYLLHDRPGLLVPPVDNLYDTGDIVSVDMDGFVTIRGRAKRFAKIGGEMVSLTAVEQYLSQLWPDFAHAVVAAPDAKKGEQLLLLTEQKGAKRADIQAHVKAEGISELSIPKVIFEVDALPLLGTGKLDYPAIATLAKELQG